MWSGKFYHNYGELSREDKGGASRKCGAVCDLFRLAADLGFQLPKQVRHCSSCTRIARILYMIRNGKSRGKFPDAAGASGEWSFLFRLDGADQVLGGVAVELRQLLVV